MMHDCVTYLGVVAVGHSHLVGQPALPVLGQEDLVAACVKRVCGGVWG